MNKIIILIVKGDEYNKTLKWNSVEEFKESLDTGYRLPNSDDVIVEASIDDNIIDIGNTFKVTLDKLKMIIDL